MGQNIAKSRQRRRRRRVHLLVHHFVDVEIDERLYDSKVVRDWMLQTCILRQKTLNRN